MAATADIVARNLAYSFGVTDIARMQQFGEGICEETENGDWFFISYIGKYSILIYRSNTQQGGGEATSHTFS